MLYPVELRALMNRAEPLPSTPGTAYLRHRAMQLVGAEGFEPPTSSSQSWRSTRLSYTPEEPVGRTNLAARIVMARWSDALPRLPPSNKKGAEAPCLSDGAPGRIRTSDPQVRSLVLYPTELRARRSESMRQV